MTQANSFDLSSLDAVGAAPLTARVTLIADADGEPVSGLIIVNKDSDEYQGENAKLRTEGLQRSAKRQTQIDAKTEEGAVALNSLITGNETRLALSVVVGWFGFSSNGEDAPFNKATVAKMFAMKPTWQAKTLAALEADANFTKR